MRVRMYGKYDLVAFIVKGINGKVLLFYSSIDSKHLYIPLIAHPLRCSYAASLMHLPSHARMTRSSLLEHAIVDWLYNTHSHILLFPPCLSRGSWHTSFSRFRFITMSSCSPALLHPSWYHREYQSEEWKCTLNDALISGADLAHQQLSVDRGTLQKNNLRLHF